VAIASSVSPGWQVHSWVWMSNHYHLLVEAPEANLVKGMITGGAVGAAMCIHAGVSPGSRCPGPSSYPFGTCNGLCVSVKKE